MTRAIPVIVTIIALLYLFGVITKDQMNSRAIKRAEEVNTQLTAILGAAEEHYRLDAETRDGADPWKVEFQFERVTDLWPDLFAIVEDASLQPNDPFDPENKPYLVATQGNIILALSVGPDRLMNVSPEEIEKAFDDETYKQKTQGEWAYDPAAGSKSPGDVIVLGEYKN